jgi:hypothetical protein
MGVAINVTAVPGGANGHLRVWPADIIVPPTASMVNYTAGENVANQGAVKTWFSTAATPDIKIFASSATNVVVDVVGYYYPTQNEIRDGSFQAGGGFPDTFFDPANGIINLKFLAPPATVTVDGPGQLIHVVSSRAFGTNFGFASGLVLSICSERTDVPAAITPVLPGMGAAPGNDIGLFGAGQTIPMSLNAAVVLPAGAPASYPRSYDVGLCGFVRFGNAFQWDRNDAGYTTAFVVQR